MPDFILRFLQRFGLWVGAMLIGAVVWAGGLKVYEHANYLPTEATVTAHMLKCDMSYRSGRFRSVHRVVECSDVAAVKAQSPGENWRVSYIPYVEVAYATPAGQPVRSVVSLGRLGRSTAAVGEKISILESPQSPHVISGPVNLNMLRMWGVMLGIGIILFGGALWIKSLRQRRERLAKVPRALAMALEMPSPASEPALRQWRERATVQAGGR